MIVLAQRCVAWLMNRVLVNHIHRAVRDGVPVVIKRRRFGGSVIIWFANRFLALAHSGAHMFVRADEWTRWERHCVRLLYPDQPDVMVERRAVSLPEVQGRCVREFIEQDPQPLQAVQAAAREVRRIHAVACDDFQSAWSHGDLHLENILYDPQTDRAVVIDFDVRHDRQVPAAARQADDLLGFLLELLAESGDDWLTLAQSFVEEYDPESCGNLAALEQLHRRCEVPRGFARVYWFTRTNDAAISRMRPRLAVLQELIAQRIAVRRNERRGH